MKFIDKVANRVGLVREVGETDAHLLYRTRCVYQEKPYGVQLPLLKLLDKLKLRSTKFLFNRVPR